MAMALSIQPYACQYYHDFSNYDPGLTLTLFTQKSTLVTKAFVIYFLETISALGLKSCLSN